MKAFVIGLLNPLNPMKIDRPMSKNRQTAIKPGAVKTA
jgi:hypothetical protein